MSSTNIRDEMKNVLDCAEAILKKVRAEGRPRTHVSENGIILNLGDHGQWFNECTDLEKELKQTRTTFESSPIAYVFLINDVRIAFYEALRLQRRYLEIGY
jgi:hypothetical protein